MNIFIHKITIFALQDDHQMFMRRHVIWLNKIPWPGSSGVGESGPAKMVCKRYNRDFY